MRVFLIMVAIVIALMVILGVGIMLVLPVPHNSPRYTAQDWTVFADVYGAVVGTFFAGLAFAGVIWTIRLQQRELKETREELARTADA